MNIKNMSLTGKLIAGAMTLTIVPLAIVGLIAINASTSALDEQIRDTLQGRADAISSHLESVIHEKEYAVSAAAADPLFAEVAADHRKGSLSPERLAYAEKTLLHSLRGMGDDLHGLWLVDTEGTIFADAASNGSTSDYDNVNVRSRDYFREIGRTREVTMGDMVLSKATGKPIYVIVAPVFSDSQEFLGAVGASIDAASLIEVVNETKMGKSGYGWVINENATIIAHPNPEHILALDMTRLGGMEAIVQDMQGRQSGVEYYTFEGIDKIAGYAPIGIHNWSAAFTIDEEEIFASVIAMEWAIGVAVIAVTIIGLTVALLFSRKISRQLIWSVQEVSTVSGNVAQATSQLHETSIFLAESSSEQAASIEETSSSMEELASMTRSNNQNATRASELVRSSESKFAHVESAMKQLESAMSEVSQASENTQKVIKTIDEIAFQTNLLALNAAVEAARAGEAGAGFAVVADEVRSLALRAAESAKNTSEIISTTVSRVSDGTKLVTEVTGSFADVKQNSDEISQLVQNISTATNEQTQGIDQINTAVSQLDQKVQDIAARSEEAASASQELQAQTESLNHVVLDLNAIATGKREQDDGSAGKLKLHSQEKKAKPSTQAHRPKQDSDNKGFFAKSDFEEESHGHSRSTERQSAQWSQFSDFSNGERED